MLMYLSESIACLVNTVMLFLLNPWSEWIIRLKSSSARCIDGQGCAIMIVCAYSFLSREMQRSFRVFVNLPKTKSVVSIRCLGVFSRSSRRTT